MDNGPKVTEKHMRTYTHAHSHKHRHRHRRTDDIHADKDTHTHIDNNKRNRHLRFATSIGAVPCCIGGNSTLGEKDLCRRMLPQPSFNFVYFGGFATIVGHADIVLLPATAADKYLNESVRVVCCQLQNTSAQVGSGANTHR